MNEPEPIDIAKLLIISGILLATAGVVVLLINKFGITKIPGDMKFGDENFKVYFPLGTCIIISIVLSLIMWLIRMFGK